MISKARQCDSACTYDELVLANDMVDLNEWRELPVEEFRGVDISDQPGYGSITTARY
jgi:hypothetical protein